MFSLILALVVVCVVGIAAQASTRRSSAVALFDELFPAPSWAPWKSALAAMQGLTVTDAKGVALIRRCTGGLSRFLQAAETWVFIVGRRGGKTRFVAGLAVYLSCFKKYKPVPGERLVGMLLAADRRQARILKDYISGLLHALPALAALIVKETAETIELSNGITIEIHTSSFRSVRGYACIFCLCDELAFWPTDGVETDREILAALRPTLLTTGGPLIIISTPHARIGALYELHQRHYGRDGDTRVWVAPSIVMNPTLDQRIIDKAFFEDPDGASAEYDAVFRSDLTTLFDRAALDACVIAGRRELPPQAGLLYTAFADPSGGSSDSFAVCIGHKDGNGRAVVDVLREWPAPFDPAVVTAECAALLKRYGVSTLIGDRYAAEWVVSQFRQHAISYQPSEQNKSELFIEALAVVNSRQCELPDNPRLLGQFAGLQRRTGSAGRDSVDHRPNQKDDLANAVAGSLAAALRSSGLPMLPADFSVCNRALSGLPSTGSACYLFGGDFRPPHDVICKSCVGNKFVQEARRAHQQRSGAWVDVVTFYREHLAPNAAMQGRMLRQVGQRLADQWGI